MKLTPALLLCSALPLAAQTAASTPAKTIPAHPVHHSAAAAGGCAKLPSEISPKVPSLPAGAACPKILFTLVTRPQASIEYASPAASPTLAAYLGIESNTVTEYYADTKVGTGAPAEGSKYYTVNYTGYLADGTKFDSSLDRKEPFQFTVGQHAVVPGWDLGFGGMKVGGSRRLYIPWELGYGTRPQAKIPPKSMLIFDIDLVAVTNTPPPPRTPPTPPAGARPVQPLQNSTPGAVTPSAKPGAATVTPPARTTTTPAGTTTAPTTPATTNPTADPTKPTTAPPPVTTPNPTTPKP